MVTVISADALARAGSRAGRVSAGAGSVLFITLNAGVEGDRRHATLFFCTSLFAASRSFHSAVARYSPSASRCAPARSCPTGRQGAPSSAPGPNLIITAIILVLAVRQRPVLQLFTLTNQRRWGILLLALASF
jgi:hypothetical protein